MVTTVMDEDVCPYCGHQLDRISTPEDSEHTPKPDDVTVCIQCASPLILTQDLRVRMPTPAELLELSTMPELLRVVQAIGRTHGKAS